MSTIIVIPARYASTRFPGKPLADIAGKTMIRRVYEQCSQATLADRVIVATDDERIAREVTSFGGEYSMTPSDCASGTERMAFVARSVPAEIYVNVQGDEPLMNPDTIDSTIRPMLADPTIDIGTACCPGSDAGDLANPNVVKVVRTLTGRALYFSRAPIPFGRDVAPIECLPAMRKHLGIYAYRAEALHRFAELPESVFEQLEKLEQLRALENGMHIHVTDVPHDSHAVDVPDDVARILEIMSH